MVANPMRILVVEDYPPVRNALVQGLREAGFAVDDAADGEVALWRAQASEYDAIVLDLMLPKLDGLTVLRRLREAGYERPVLILTAKDQVVDRVRGLDLGGDDYLVKPFAFEELLARVRALIRRQYDKPTSVITLGDLRIDTAAHRVWRDDEEILLTAREYAILEYLASRSGQVVSRSDIWEHAYDFNATNQSNVVDVYISYLRLKLDRPDDAVSRIRTVRGSGYMLAGPG